MRNTEFNVLLFLSFDSSTLDKSGEHHELFWLLWIFSWVLHPDDPSKQVSAGSLISSLSPMVKEDIASQTNDLSAELKYFKAR